MTKYVSKQITALGAKGSAERQEWLRTDDVVERLAELKKVATKAQKAAVAVGEYTDGVDLDLEVSQLSDLLIQLEVSLEQAWVHLFGPSARIVYDYMRGDVRTDRLTRDTMSDFIASAAPSRSEHVAIKRKHLK
jgi:hypothetical protein